MLEQFTNHRLNRWILSVLSGVLLVLSFPETGSMSLLSFVAWIPLLLVENHFTKQKKAFSFFLLSYLCCLIFNVGTTWWIYNSSAGGAYMAFIANSLLMALFLVVFHLMKRRLGKFWGGILFVSTWLSFEFLHFHWELSWPWLTLGNVFAEHPSWIQWYATTGALGGTLWILCINYLLYLVITKPSSTLKSNYALWSALILFIVPLTVSLISFYQPEKKGLPYEVVVLQPNVDPYGEKFTGNNEEQLDDLLAQADAHVTKQTKMVIAPETALYPTAKIYEQSIRKEVFTHKINERRAKWNKAPFLIGASTYQGFDHKVSAAATYYKPFDIYIEDYNSSILFDHTQQPKIIHKSKLVLGVEKIPFVGAFPFLEKLAVQMEGGSGSLGVEKGPKVFQAGKVAFAPAICYESVYGEWVAQQCKQGAQFIAVITNDGWWKDTPGYKQHFHLARLRAIENRKYVVHAANTGTSGIISSKGEVLKTTAWWQKVAFNYTIQLNQEQTVYQQYGDILGVISVIVSISLLFTALFKILLRIKSRSLKH